MVYSIINCNQMVFSVYFVKCPSLFVQDGSCPPLENWLQLFFNLNKLRFREQFVQGECDSEEYVGSLLLGFLTARDGSSFRDGSEMGLGVRQVMWLHPRV